MGGSVGTLTAAVSGGNSHQDTAAMLALFPTRTKSPSTNALMPKKVLFEINLLHFGNWCENEETKPLVPL